MRRLLALLGAVAMIVGAVAARRIIDDDDGNGSGDDTGGETGGSSEIAFEDLRILCATEATLACDVLGRAGAQTTKEDPGLTTLRLSDPKVRLNDLGFDIWLVSAPWPAMVDDARQRAGAGVLFDAASDVIARTPAVIVVRADRAEVLRRACGTVSWRCIGDNAGDSWEDLGGEARWGDPKLGLEDAATTTAGLVDLAQLTATFQNGSTSYSSNDLDSRYRRWLQGLTDAMRGGSAGTPLERMLRSGLSELDMVGSIEALAGPTVAASRERDRVEVLVPDPIATADLVAVGRIGLGEEATNVADRDDLGPTLAAAGWRVDGEALSDGIDDTVTLPPDAGLPSAGTLIALTVIWTEESS